MDHIDESPLTAEEKANLDLLKITDSGILTGVTDKEKLAGRLVLPDTVTEIDRQALSGCEALMSIIIPNSVIKIECCAFSQCKNLMKLTVDDANTAYCSENNILYTKNESGSRSLKRPYCHSQHCY